MLLTVTRTAAILAALTGAAGVIWQASTTGFHGGSFVAGMYVGTAATVLTVVATVELARRRQRHTIEQETR